MYALTEESITNLLEASQQLHGKMVQSIVWDMLKEDSVVKQWMFALNAVESQVKRKEMPSGAQESH